MEEKPGEMEKTAEKERLETTAIKEKTELPEGTGRRMWNIVLRLLADQENVEIRYELVTCEEKQETD